MRRLGAAGLALAGVLAAGVDALGRDGIRAGPWRPEPLPIALLAVVFILGMRVPRAPRVRGLHALAALASVFIGLAAVQVWRSSPADRPAPLAARVEAAGKLTSREIALHSLRAPARLADALGFGTPGEIVVDGFVHVPETGTHAFETDCGGACSVSIDDRVVISGAGHTHAAAELTAGAWPVRFVLRAAERRPYARFDWNRPAFFEAASLAEAVTPTPAEPDPRGRERRVLLRAVCHWSLALAAAFLVLDLGASARRAAPALPGAARTWLADPAHRAALVAAGLALVFLGALHAWIAPRALPGGYLHAWTSEFMMQTVSVADLRDEPLRSLVFNHIQPPSFDALRAALVAWNSATAGDDPAALVTAVDRGLYVCWGLAYALGAALVTTWVARLAGTAAGALASLVYALHPATLFYATYLDSTLVSALGIAWVTYELWRFGPGGRGSAVRLGAAVVSLFLTRSVVQWPFVVLLAVALLLRGCPPRRTLRTVAAIALVMAIFLAKQYAVFGLAITSSFGPDSFCKGLWVHCPGHAPVDMPPLPAPLTASALRRVAKAGDEYNYNQLAFLRRSFSQMEEYERHLRGLPPPEIARRLARNFAKWLLPSSRHSPHVLVDALPWRGIGDRLLSGGVLAAFVLGAGSIWLFAARGDPAAVRAGLGLALPIFYVAAVSVAFERNENMRYKFFVEPVLIVLLASQAAAAARATGIPGFNPDREPKA